MASARVAVREELNIQDANLSKVSVAYLGTNTCPSYPIRDMLKGGRVPMTLSVCFHVKTDNEEDILDKLVYLLAEKQVANNVIVGTDDYIQINGMEYVNTLVNVLKVETLPYSGPIWSQRLSCIADPEYDYDQALLARIHKFSNSSFGCISPIMGGYSTHYPICNSSDIRK